MDCAKTIHLNSTMSIKYSFKFMSRRTWWFWRSFVV